MSALKVTSNVNLVAFGFVLQLIMFVMVKWIAWMGRTNGNAQKVQVKFIHCFLTLLLEKTTQINVVFYNLHFSIILGTICTVLN